MHDEEPPKSNGPPYGKFEKAEADVFGLWYLRLTPSLENRFRSKGLRDDDAVAEALHRLFMKLWTGKGFNVAWLRDFSAFKAHVFAFADHVIADMLEEAKPIQFVAFEGDEQPDLAAEDDPQVRLELEQLEVAAEQADKQLTPRERTVLELRREGLKRPAIGERMGITLNSVKTLLGRGRQGLEDSLKELGHEDALVGRGKGKTKRKTKRKSTGPTEATSDDD